MFIRVQALLLIFLFVISPAANANLLKCRDDGQHASAHVIFGGITQASCRGNHGQYDLTIFGVGPGISWGLPEFKVACVGPAEGFYIGLGLTASAIYGVNGGIYLGALGGACVIGGIGYEVGIKAILGFMVIGGGNLGLATAKHLSRLGSSALLFSHESESEEENALAFYYKERTLDGGEVLKRVRIASKMADGQVIYRTQMEKFGKNEDWEIVSEATRSGVKSLQQFLGSLRPFENKLLLEQANQEDWDTALQAFAGK